MTKKLLSLFVLTAVILASTYLAEAQQGNKVYRIGFLTSRSRARSVSTVKEGLRELGYVEGRDFAIVHRYVQGTAKGFPELTAELVDLKVDVIVTPASGAAFAAKKATTAIPIVVVTGVDFVKSGLAASLARPGGNVTGFSTRNSELAGKQLELFREAFPNISRVAVLWDGDSRSSSTRTFPQIKAAAAASGVELHSMKMRQTESPDFDTAFKAAMKKRVGAFFVVSGRFLSDHRARIVELVAKTRLPAMYNHSRWVRAGGLMSYAPLRRDLYLLAATYVDKILKGVKPADLPVQRATRIYLDINLKTAKKLGLNFSPQFLARADKVIK